MKITTDGFSIHTFEMNIQITYYDFCSIKELLFNKKSIRKRTENVWVSNLFREYGITLYLLNSKLLPSYFKIEVNPNTLLEGYNPYKIFHANEENILTVRERINEILIILEANFSFDDMSISRIDLCVNCDMEDSDIIDSYMRLLKKCLLPSGFIRDNFYSKFDNYKGKNKHLMHAHNDNIILNIYNKSYQVIDQNIAPNSNIFLENILRVEVGLLRSEIRNIINTMMYSKDLSKNDAFLEFVSLHSKFLMKQYLHRFFTKDKYVTYCKAQELIRKAEFDYKIEDRMLYLLENVSVCKHMNVAVIKLIEKYDLSDTQVKYLMKRFHKLGIQPVTMKNSERNLSELPGLLYIFDLPN